MSGLTLVGLGSMGAAIGHAFLKAGIKLTVWNRTTTRPAVQELIEAGALFEPDLPTALATSPTTLFCVLSYENIDNLLNQLKKTGAENVLHNKTIINLTNGTPRQARELHENMHQSFNVARYFDGGIMVTPQAVGQPFAIVFISGKDDETSFNDSHAKYVVSQIGAPQYIASDPGAAALYDLALLAGMYGLFAGSFTAMAMMRKQKDHPQIAPPVSKYLTPLLQFMAPHIDQIARAWDDEDWSNQGNPMEMQRIAVSNILQTCEEEGVDGGSLKHFAEIMEKLVHTHGGEGGIAQIGPLMLK